MEPNSKTTLRSPELLKMLINRARPEISEIEEIYLTTKGSTGRSLTSFHLYGSPWNGSNFL